MNPSTSTIVAPEPFNFAKPEDWPKWIRRYWRYRIASGLVKKIETIQVNSLLYTMGDNADDIMTSLVFDPEEDSVKYEKVKEKLNKHFVVKRNTIYERVQSTRSRRRRGGRVLYYRIILSGGIFMARNSRHAICARAEQKKHGW